MRDMRSTPSPKPGDPKTTYGGEDIRIQQNGDTAIVAFRLVETTEKDGKGVVTKYLNTGALLKRNGNRTIVSFRQACVTPTPQSSILAFGLRISCARAIAIASTAPPDLLDLRSPCLRINRAPANTVP